MGTNISHLGNLLKLVLAGWSVYDTIRYDTVYDLVFILCYFPFPSDFLQPTSQMEHGRSSGLSPTADQQSQIINHSRT